jgi:gliding motility-associated-like protein
MKQLAFFALAFFYCLPIFSQSNSCTSATVINIGTACNPQTGSTASATQSLGPCTGNSDDDIWYQFTAVSVGASIQVIPSAGFDPVLHVMTGSCGNLSTLACENDGGTGVTETIHFSNLIIGNSYKIRLYHFGLGSGTGSFSICVSNLSPAPSNNSCGNALPIVPQLNCTFSLFNNTAATQSIPGCSGNADDDVWFLFSATQATHTIIVDPISSIDPVLQVFSGTCGNLIPLNCVDNNGLNGSEQLLLTGLIPGQQYRFRVYDFYGGEYGQFQVCVSGNSPTAVMNDEPCSAFQLPDVSTECQYLEFNNTTATNTTGVPIPQNCNGGAFPQQGGFSSASKDLWFKFIVPPTGSVYISAKPNIGVNALIDGVMVIYAGSCNSLTQVACSDDYPAYPGTSHDFLPMIHLTNQVPGNTLYLRYFGFGSSAGKFGFCVATAENDQCVNALEICDINGYSASTSPVFTADRPGNMRGNNEDINGVNMPDGTNTGGIFGQAGSWGNGAPFYDVTINNNSWIVFTAADSNATLNVQVSNCFVGNYPSGGLQMQLFSGSNCSSFIPVSSFMESSSSFNLTASNLIPGNKYYLMVDGYAGDVCNYSITASAGIQFPSMPTYPTICAGDSIQISAPPGAVSYEWIHSGENYQQIWVTPAVTQTFECELTGLCDHKQLVQTTITVQPIPDLGVTVSDYEICEGDSVIAVASGANQYNWNTGQIGTSIEVIPNADTTLIVTGLVGTCSSNDTVHIAVLFPPTWSQVMNSNAPDCGLNNGSIELVSIGASGTATFSWQDAFGNVIGSSNPIQGLTSGNYYVDVSDNSLCTLELGPFALSNPNAPNAANIVTTDSIYCQGESIVLNIQNPMSGLNYLWSNSEGEQHNGPEWLLDSISTLGDVQFCVQAIENNCGSALSCVELNLTEPETVTFDFGGDSLFCEGESIGIDVNLNNPLWTNPGGIPIGVSLNLASFTTNDSGYYFLTGLDANGCQVEDSIYLSPLIAPFIEIDSLLDNVLCGTDTIQLIANGNGNISWFGPNELSQPGNSLTIANSSLQQTGWYYAFISDVHGCSNSDSLFLLVTSSVFDLGISDTSICPSIPFSLNQPYSNLVWNGPQSYYSSNSTLVLTNPQIEQQGWYIASWTDSHGCEGFDSLWLAIESSSDCLLIPELVTPNEDGINDDWNISGLSGYSNPSIAIHNRWGVLVFYEEPFLGQWNTKSNRGWLYRPEEKIPTGTYYYILQLNDASQTILTGFFDVQY